MLEVVGHITWVRRGEDLWRGQRTLTHVSSLAVVFAPPPLPLAVDLAKVEGGRGGGGDHGVGEEEDKVGER
jgi:hypothetical protein